jgi:hypothetical protein
MCVGGDLSAERIIYKVEAVTQDLGVYLVPTSGTLVTENCTLNSSEEKKFHRFCLQVCKFCCLLLCAGVGVSTVCSLRRFQWAAIFLLSAPTFFVIFLVRVIEMYTTPGPD